MFWKLLCACLVAIIISKLGEWLVGVNVRKLGEWLVGAIVFKFGERWVVEPIVRKIESIVCKVAERLVKGIRLVEKIVCKVAEWLVKEIGYVLSCYEILYVHCKDNMLRLKVEVDLFTLKLRYLEEAARHNEQRYFVRAWQEHSAVEWANKVLKDAERA